MLFLAYREQVFIFQSKNRCLEERESTQTRFACVELTDRGHWERMGMEDLLPHGSTQPPLTMWERDMHKVLQRLLQVCSSLHGAALQLL